MHPAKYLVETRSSLIIYRDCTKLIHRMVNDPTKAKAAQVLLRKQFQKHKQQFDSDKIHDLKMKAVTGISNYLIYTVQRDYHLLKKRPVNVMDETTHEEDEDRRIELEAEAAMEEMEDERKSNNLG